MLYKYKISYFEEAEEKMVTSRGFVAGANIADAIKEVVTYYAGTNEENIEFVKITPTEGSLHETECVTNS